MRDVMEKKELDSTLMTFEQWCKSKWGAQTSPLNPVRDWDKWQTACTQDKAVLVESLLERLEPYLALQAVRLRVRTPIIPQADKE